MTGADREALAAAGLPVDREPVTVADVRSSSTFRGLFGFLSRLTGLERAWAALPAPVRASTERVVHLRCDGRVDVYRIDREG